MFNKEESDYVTGVYRCKDSIKNFRIRVRLQHEKSSFIPLPQFQQEESDIQSAPQVGEGSEIEERIFSWQEKVFSPFEISYYRYSGNCHTALEEKYHRDVAALCRESTPTNRLFTYIDADDFTDMEEANQSVTTDAKPIMTSLVEGMSELRRRQKFGHRKSHRKDIDFSKRNIVDYNPNIKIKKKNHLLQTSLQTLYILADLSVKDSDENWVGKSEYVLCTVRWDSVSGVLTVTPDFTSLSASGSQDSRLEPYRIEVDGDARNTYRYWIEHSSVDMAQEERDKEFAVINKLCEHHLDIRHLQVGSEFDIPRHGTLQVNVLGEVSSAKHFEYDDLFIYYFFDLPIGWSCDTGHELSGVTQTCSTRRTGIANFSYLFELPLTFNLEVLQSETDNLLTWPQMFFVVMSLDSWNRSRSEGYGYISLPSTPGLHTRTISTWRPLSNGSVGEMRRFFIGGSPELEDPTFVGLPSNFEGRLLSKHGLHTITSGDVTLKFNIMHQSQALIGSQAPHGGAGDSRAKKLSSFLLERLSAATLVNSVNSVLIAFKRARERMLKAREGLET